MAKYASFRKCKQAIMLPVLIHLLYHLYTKAVAREVGGLLERTEFPPPHPSAQPTTKF